MKPVQMQAEKIEELAFALDQEIEDARRHKIQLLRSEESKWKQDEFLRSNSPILRLFDLDQNIETRRKNEGVISETVTDFKLSRDKKKVDRLIDTYEKTKTKFSLNKPTTPPAKKSFSVTKTANKSDEKRIIFQSTSSKKFTPKLDYKNMKTVADFKPLKAPKIKLLPDHKKQVQSFKERINIIVEKLSIQTKNPYKIIQSLIKNPGPFYQKNPDTKDQRVNLPVKVEDSLGNVRDFDIQIDTQKLEKHLLEKYSTRLFLPQANQQFIIRQMANEYASFFDRMVQRALTVRIPREFKVSLDDFNDFYTRKSQAEIQAELEAEEEARRAASQKTLEEQVMTYLEEQVNVLTENILTTETEEPPLLEIPIQEVQTERTPTQNDELKPPELKPAPLSYRTLYEEEEDEEEFQRRQEEKKRRRQKEKTEITTTLTLPLTAATDNNPMTNLGTDSTEGQRQEGTDTMRRDIQAYIDKLNEDIIKEEQEQERMKTESSQHTQSHANQSHQQLNKSLNNSIHYSRQGSQAQNPTPQNPNNTPQVGQSQFSNPNIHSQHISLYPSLQSQNLSATPINKDQSGSYPTFSDARLLTNQTPDSILEHRSDGRGSSTTPDDFLDPSKIGDRSSQNQMLILSSQNFYKRKESQTPDIPSTSHPIHSKQFNRSSTFAVEGRKSSFSERGPSILKDSGRRGSTDHRTDTEMTDKSKSPGKRGSVRFAEQKEETKSRASSREDKKRGKFQDYEKYDRASLIQLLLEADSILDSDIKIRDYGELHMPEDYKFENDQYKTLFKKVYTWHQYLNRELKFQEAELHLDPVVSSESSGGSDSSDDDY